jgi:hypothetical protein
MVEIKITTNPITRTGDCHDRLKKIAEYHGYGIEELCSEVIYNWVLNYERTARSLLV